MSISVSFESLCTNQSSPLHFNIITFYIFTLICSNTDLSILFTMTTVQKKVICSFFKQMLPNKLTQPWIFFKEFPVSLDVHHHRPQSLQLLPDCVTLGVDRHDGIPGADVTGDSWWKTGNDCKRHVTWPSGKLPLECQK